MSRNTKETSLIHPGERKMSTPGRHHGRLVGMREVLERP